MKILLENLMKDEKYYDYKPMIAYEGYDGLYDETARKINAIGVGDNSIMISADLSMLLNSSHSMIRIKHCVTTIENYKDFLDALTFIQEKFANPLNIKVKNYAGVVMEINEVVIDDELKRIVFIA